MHARNSQSLGNVEDLTIKRDIASATRRCASEWTARPRPLPTQAESSHPYPTYADWLASNFTVIHMCAGAACDWELATDSSTWRDGQNRANETHAPPADRPHVETSRAESRSLREKYDYPIERADFAIANQS